MSATRPEERETREAFMACEIRGKQAQTLDWTSEWIGTWIGEAEQHPETDAVLYNVIFILMNFLAHRVGDKDLLRRHLQEDVDLATGGQHTAGTA